MRPKGNFSAAQFPPDGKLSDVDCRFYPASRIGSTGVIHLGGLAK